MTGKPTWVIEADVFPAEESEPFRAELRRQGFGVELVRHDLIVRGMGPGAGAAAIFRGSHPLMRHVQLHRGWVPGGWCDFDRLDCRAYYPEFGPFLLNGRHRILPVADAIRGQEALFEEFGVAGQVFVRPSGCVKQFAGRVVNGEGFAPALGGGPV